MAQIDRTAEDGRMESRQMVAAVVLGARVNDDGQPCAAFRRRLEAAASLWHEGQVLLVCVTGGVRWAGHVESCAGRVCLQEAGVAAEAIVTDPWSVSTRSNARAAFCLLSDVPVFVVTDGYHMRRALRSFRARFHHAEPFSVRSPFRLRARLREVLARIVHRFRASKSPEFATHTPFTARVMLPTEAEACAAVRRVVFQLGQRVPVDIERDGRDGEAHQWVLRKGAAIVGTARARSIGTGVAKVERVAVLGCFRGLGAGRTLMEAVHRGLVAEGFVEAKLHAQQDVIGFYEAIGYVAEGEVFYEADIPHVAMRRALTS